MSIKLPVQLLFDLEQDQENSQITEPPPPEPPRFMRKPVSASFEPWTSYPRLPFHFLQENFVHEALLDIKMNVPHRRGGVEANHYVYSTIEGPSFMNEQRAWMSLPGNRSMYLKVHTNNYMKFQLDNGTTRFFGKPFSFYAGISSPHNFKYLSTRVGLRHISKTDHVDFRLKLATGNKPEFSIAARTLYKLGKFRIGEVAMLDIYSMVLNHFNALVGYKIDDKVDLFFRAEHTQHRRSNPQNLKALFDHFILDGIYKHNEQTTIAGEIAVEPSNHILKWVQLVFERQLKKEITTKIKAKASRGILQCAVTARFPLLDRLGRFSLGIYSINPHKIDRLFSWGTQLEFNL